MGNNKRADKNKEKEGKKKFEKSTAELVFF